MEEDGVTWFHYQILPFDRTWKILIVFVTISLTAHSSLLSLLVLRVSHGKICYLLLVDNREGIIVGLNVSQALQIDIHSECHMAQWQSKQPLYDPLDEMGNSTNPDGVDDWSNQNSVFYLVGCKTLICDSLATICSTVGWFSN